MFPPYEKLARFAGDLATCLSAGLGVPKSLKMATRVLANTRLAPAMEVALERVTEGTELAEALGDAQRLLPAFFVPVVRAGEQAGRLAESLRYLEHHCKAIAGPARAVRNTWLIPLGLVIAGSAVKLLAHLVFGNWDELFRFLRGSLVNYALLGAVAWILFASPFRLLFDHVKLVLPWVGAAERDLAVNRFFQVFAMLYAAAGHRVEEMIRFAAKAVTNIALRRDLLAAATEIERGSTIADAFEVPVQLSREQKDSIAVGELAGKLDEASERISNQAGDSLIVRLTLVNRFLFRLTMFVVICSVVQTLYYLVVMSASR